MLCLIIFLIPIVLLFYFNYEIPILVFRFFVRAYRLCFFFFAQNGALYSLCFAVLNLMYISIILHGK